MQLLVRLLRVAVIAVLRGLYVRTKPTLTARKKHGQALSKKQDEGLVLYTSASNTKYLNSRNPYQERICEITYDFINEIAIGKFVYSGIIKL